MSIRYGIDGNRAHRLSDALLPQCDPGCAIGCLLSLALRLQLGLLHRASWATVGQLTVRALHTSTVLCWTRSSWPC